jgi:heme-degrading monooxygenase HmoA
VNQGIVIAWEFRVRAGCEAEFEEAYGPRGAWAALFGRRPKFFGTELLRDDETAGRYVTLDRWSSLEAFDDFRASHATAYEALDARCEKWTAAETKIRAFRVWG